MGVGVDCKRAISCRSQGLGGLNEQYQGNWRNFACPFQNNKSSFSFLFLNERQGMKFQAFPKLLHVLCATSGRVRRYQITPHLPGASKSNPLSLPLSLRARGNIVGSKRLSGAVAASTVNYRVVVP